MMSPLSSASSASEGRLLIELPEMAKRYDVSRAFPCLPLPLPHPPPSGPRGCSYCKWKRGMSFRHRLGCSGGKKAELYPVPQGEAREAGAGVLSGSRS